MSTPDDRPDRDEICAVIRQVITEIIPVIAHEDVTGEKNLRALGADSIEAVEIIVTVMDRLEVRGPLSGVGSARDINAMADFLHERIRR